MDNHRPACKYYPFKVGLHVTMMPTATTARFALGPACSDHTIYALSPLRTQQNRVRSSWGGQPHHSSLQIDQLHRDHCRSVSQACWMLRNSPVGTACKHRQRVRYTVLGDMETRFEKWIQPGSKTCNGRQYRGVLEPLDSGNCKAFFSNTPPWAKPRGGRIAYQSNQDPKPVPEAYIITRTDTGSVQGSALG